MNAEIVRQLSVITEEEQKILDGQKNINKTLYTKKKEMVVDSKHFLQKGKLIQVRTHTRFVHFPRHRHNYVELIYMCKGSTTHIIDGNKVVLEEGDLLFLNQNATQEILPAGVDEIELKEITITMVREKKPVKLLRWFEKNWYQIEEVFKGIYYITRDNHFLTQIIVSKDLSKNNQKWLTLLSRDLDKSDAKRVVSQLELLTEESEKQHGDSVLQVAVQENEEIFDKIKEEGNMCEALRKLMEPEIREEVNKAVDKAIKYAEENNRKDMIAKALNVGSSAEDISRVMGIPLAEVEAIAKKH